MGIMPGIRPLTLIPALLVGVSLGAPRATAQQIAEGWEFSGDLRLRADLDDSLAGDGESLRARLRLGASWQIDEQLRLRLRASTGDPDDAREAYATFGDGFSRFDLELDQVYLDYRPDWARGSQLTAGKFAYPFRRNPVYGQLVWDEDVQPEGLTLSYEQEEAGPFENLSFGFGQWAVFENGTGADAWATVLHASGEIPWDGDQSLEIAATFNWYNGTVAGAADFGILDALVAWNWGDFVYSTQVVSNLRADDDEDGAGAAFGAAYDTSVGRFYYQFSAIETDAVFASVAQNDFLYSNNHTTQLVGWRRALNETVGFGLSLAASDRAEEDLPGDEVVYRLRFDFDLSF